MARENTRKKATKKNKAAVTDGVTAEVTVKKEKKPSKPKHRYELRYVGANPVCQGYEQGVRYPITVEKAIAIADKRNFEVTDLEQDGAIVSKAEVEKDDDPDAHLTKADRIALRKERMAKEKLTSQSLTVDHKKNAAKIINGVPHEPDYVPTSIDDHELPPVGVPMGEDGETPTHILKAPRSQRMTDSDTSAISESRLSPTDAASLQFDANKGVTEVAQRLNTLKMPPRRG